MSSPFFSEFRLYLCNRIVSRIPSHTIRLFFYRKAMRFVIGETSSIFMGAWFDAAGNFRMGENSVINQNCRLDTRGGVVIGDNVVVTASVTILTAAHDPADPTLRTNRVEPAILEDYAFVATGAMILPGVTLGRGCMVGAGSVVTRNVDEYAIVAGNPARVIGRRPENLSYVAYYRRLFW